MLTVPPGFLIAYSGDRHWRLGEGLLPGLAHTTHMMYRSWVLML
jgi:hypothetical protein